jgi:hypothetical protein
MWSRSRNKIKILENLGAYNNQNGIDWRFSKQGQSVLAKKFGKVK